MTPGTTALSTRSLSVRFGGLAALQEVAIDVKENTIVSVIGPNGAGKSTLLNAICGLVRSRGEIIVFGRDVSGERPHHIPAHGVARSFQDPQLVDSETTLENILSGTFVVAGYTMLDQVARRWHVHACEATLAERAMQLLEMVDLAGFANRRCSELAYGPRKIVDILRALMSEPKLMLLDEPSSGLDRRERKRVEELLLTLQARRGVTMLVVEHHMDLVRAISDRVVALQSGAVLIEGPPDDVLDSQGFRQAMVGGPA